jgi:hypothetical protein
MSGAVGGDRDVGSRLPHIRVAAPSREAGLVSIVHGGNPVGEGRSFALPGRGTPR